MPTHKKRVIHLIGDFMERILSHSFKKPNPRFMWQILLVLVIELTTVADCKVSREAVKGL
jgi:hypothetical protein